MGTKTKNHRKENAKTRFETKSEAPKKQRWVPVHLRVCDDHPNTKLSSQYYPDLDLLIIKCPNKYCDQPNAEVEENFKRNKEERRRKWLEKQGLTEEEVSH